MHQKSLSNHESTEILDYKRIYFIGKFCPRKIESNPKNENNLGFDDERGDLIINVKDHIAYRYEILEIVGKGSFG